MAALIVIICLPDFNKIKRWVYKHQFILSHIQENQKFGHGPPLLLFSVCILYDLVNIV